MLEKTCAKCGIIISYGKRYCYDCQVKVEAIRARRSRPDPEIRKFRNSAIWQNKRLAILQRDNFQCQHCKGINAATEVHHVIPLHKDMSKALDDDNLISLCSECHRVADGRGVKKVQKHFR